MMKYSVLYLFCFLFFSSNLNGQSLLRSSISCFGSTFSENGIIVRQTVGQSSNTTVIKFGVLELRQGFQQPLSIGKVNSIIPYLDFSLSPNPARDYVDIKISEIQSVYTISIFDMNGSLLYNADKQVLLLNRLDLTKLIPGFYIVKVSGQDGFGTKKLIIN